MSEAGVVGPAGKERSGQGAERARSGTGKAGFHAPPPCPALRALIGPRSHSRGQGGPPRFRPCPFGAHHLTHSWEP